MSLVGSSGVNLFLPRGASKKIKAAIVYDGPLKPPIKKGDQVAVLRVVTKNEVTSDVPLFAAEDVGHGSLVERGFDALLFMVFRGLL